MVLSKAKIIELCEKNELLKDYKKENIQSCSYDLRLGSQYYYHEKINSRKVNISKLEDGDVLSIPPHAICYVITEETVNMPKNLTASISLSFGLINKGVMLAAQPPYDPGYKGKTVALLHNLSDESISIRRGDHILNMVFSELDTDVADTDLYNGSYQGLNNLSTYCKEKRVGAVFKLYQEFRRTSERFNRALPSLLTLVTVIIGILTIMFTLNTAKSSSPKYYVNEEQGTLTIDIDNKLYELGLEDSKASHDNNTQSAPSPAFFVDEEQNKIIISIDEKQYELELKSSEGSADIK